MSTPDTLYAFDLCSAYALPENRLLVRNPRNGKHAILNPDVYGTLLNCRTFQTLRSHAEAISESTPELNNQADAVLEVLESVRADGLMIASDIYAITLQPATDPNYRLDKPVVAIITWERPEALERCLASVLENCDLKNVARFYVVDDSHTESIQQRNRAATQRFGTEVDIPVSYLGAPEQKEYVDRLVAQVPALEQQIRFLIDRARWADHWSSGLSRTVAMLLGTDHRLIVLDDDILCDVHEPFQSPGLSFSDQGREARFFADEDEWPECRAEQLTDPVIRHLRCLGLPLADALRALDSKPLSAEQFKGADLELLERLHGESPVLITECGSLGDPGTARLNWLSALDDQSLEALFASDETLRNAMHTRNCWSGHRTDQISARSNMSQMTGLDNSRLLPPYIPILRGEDRLFGDMVEFMYPSSAVLDQAWALPHLPIPERRWSDEEKRYNTQQVFPLFSMKWIENNQDASQAKEPLPRLSRIARLFDDLADRDHEQLVALYEDQRIAEQAQEYGHLSHTLARSENAPAEWRAFIQGGLNQLNQSLIDNPPDATLTGYPKHLQDEALSEWWRDFWRQFANALRAWPAIRQAARQVKV